MSFLLYERLILNGVPKLRPTGKNFCLAGYNLIFQAWEKRGRPTKQGWHVTADELIKLHTNEANDYDTRRLIIDFHPGSKRLIGLIELLDIYVYSNENTSWTPLMLRLRDVLFEEFEHDISPEEKLAKVDNLPEPSSDDDFVEFLYLGPKWNWGKNGSTNAVFLQKPARDYFRAFF